MILLILESGTIYAVRDDSELEPLFFQLDSSKASDIHRGTARFSNIWEDE